MPDILSLLKPKKLRKHEICKFDHLILARIPYSNCVPNESDLTVSLAKIKQIYIRNGVIPPLSLNQTVFPHIWRESLSVIRRSRCNFFTTNESYWGLQATVVVFGGTACSFLFPLIISFHVPCFFWPNPPFKKMGFLWQLLPSNRAVKRS